MKKLLKRKIEVKDWIRIAALLLFLGALAWGGVLYSRYFRQITSGAQGGSYLENMRLSGILLRNFIVANYPNIGLALVFFLQIFHVIIAVVPSVLITFVSGMVYGVPGGVLVSAAGAAIGTAVSFYLARLLGRRVLTLFVSEKNIAKMEKIIDGNTSALVLLALFFIPSPKDYFAWFIGLTNMKASKYFLISFVGRLPTMLAAAYLGHAALSEKPNYLMLALLAVGGTALFLLFAAFNKKIMSFLKRKKMEPLEEANSQHPVD